MDIARQLHDYRERVERGLATLLPPAQLRPRRLHEAMRYSLQAGGKRLRPTLVLASAELWGSKHDALPAAVALECIHTYSLVHDDLPCMDNDDLRRGRPTAHRQFDEATALLAGDALLTFAFQLLARHYRNHSTLCTALLTEFAEAAGSEHLIGGQMEDLLAEKKSTVTAEELDYIHLHKTAAIITAAFVTGGLCGGASETDLAQLRLTGRRVGLAFQIIDDVLDATADTATLGKTAGKDARADKTTYVKLHGLDASRQHARTQSDAAIASLAQLPGETNFLRTLIEQMVSRTH
ncbi:MAG: polyprenyl synthetase family protein [Candidatus Didemnitutus sp.]|nr:polyprenyl synthetase family protein [Candidatus Didemnitutus sp.]